MTAQQQDKKLILVAPLTRVPLARDQSFFYTAPLNLSLAIGDHVHIPFGRRSVGGVVTDITPAPERAGGMTIKSIKEIIEKNALTQEQLALATLLSTRYLCPLGLILPLFLFEKVIPRIKRDSITFPALNPLTLSEDAVDIRTRVMEHSTDDLTIDTGGSVESTIFLASLIEQILLREGEKQILILVSERTQCAPLLTLMERTFPHEIFALVHANLSAGTRTRTWQKIRKGEVRIIIGTRRALFAPFSSLSHIILTQCHDMAYKQWKAHPYYDVRAIAPTIASLYSAQLIRISDAPRLGDRNQEENATLYTLPEGKVRRITIINMREAYWKYNEKRRTKKRPLLSEELIHNIKETVARGGISLLLINRQGKNAFSICTKCSHIFQCPQCDRALVERSAGHYNCLHCTYKSDAFPSCPHCSNLSFRSVGTGTESIIEEVHRAIPGARTVRIDAESLTTTTKAQKIYADTQKGSYNVIVGTQMATKVQWHSKITHTAILDMDILLGSTDYDAHEKALAHVRTLYSRCAPGGTLSIQTYDLLHPVMDHIRNITTKKSLRALDAFYEEELGMRAILKFPPASHLLKLTHKNKDQSDAERISAEVYENLIDRTNAIVSEPHVPLIAKHRSMHYIQIVIKYQETLSADLHIYLTSLDKSWTIDVDPESIT